MIGDIMQPTHLLFVLVIALLVLGPKRLPEVGRQLGSGLRDFRAAINGERTDRHDDEPTEAGSSSGAHQLHEDATGFAGEHQFAHEAVEPAAEEHTFVHESATSVSDGQAVAHDPAGAGARGGVTTAPGEHEFAHEPVAGAETRPDPLA